MDPCMNQVFQPKRLPVQGHIRISSNLPRIHSYCIDLYWLSTVIQKVIYLSFCPQHIYKSKYFPFSFLPLAFKIPNIKSLIRMQCAMYPQRIYLFTDYLSFSAIYYNYCWWQGWCCQWTKIYLQFTTWNYS